MEKCIYTSAAICTVVPETIIAVTYHYTYYASKLIGDNNSFLPYPFLIFISFPSFSSISFPSLVHRIIILFLQLSSPSCKSKQLPHLHSSTFLSTSYLNLLPPFLLHSFPIPFACSSSHHSSPLSSNGRTHSIYQRKQEMHSTFQLQYLEGNLCIDGRIILNEPYGNV